MQRRAAENSVARKLISFHPEEKRALDELAEDRASTFQELIDEAVRDLLKKHRRPAGVRDALKASAGSEKVVRFEKRKKR
jgi:predicted transcriptional regulator